MATIGPLAGVIVMAGALLAWRRSSESAAQAPSRRRAAKTTLSGVYTEAQAEKGEEIYYGMCVSCHPKGTYAGDVVQERTGTAGRCRICATGFRTRCPRTIPGTLTPEQVVQVMAYILQQNKMPAGSGAMPPTETLLGTIKIQIEVDANRRRHMAVTSFDGPHRGSCAGLAGFALAGAVALPSAARRAAADAGLVRGNAPGEWRYWGADAWSTRYSAARSDQRVELQQRSRSRGSGTRRSTATDEYYRTTPLYANGRLFTVATTHRYAYAIDPGDGQDAVVVEARRRHPLAEGAAPVRRPRTRLLDRRPRQRARDRRDARLSHGHPRREDRQGRSRRSARTASSI